jgi:hypothetical protein
VVALWLLREAVRRLDAGRSVPADSLTGRDLAALIRGVRFIFLAAAAFAAGAGWLLGHPLPFVIALVIAGVDVLETSLLLLVVAIRPDSLKTCGTPYLRGRYGKASFATCAREEAIIGSPPPSCLAWLLPSWMSLKNALPKQHC